MTPDAINADQAFQLITVCGALALALIAAFHELDDQWRVRPNASRY